MARERLIFAPRVELAQHLARHCCADLHPGQRCRLQFGVRQKKDTAFARFGTWSSGALCNLFHATHYRDFNSAFKLVAGPLMRGVTLEAKGLNYSTEVTSRLLERRAEMVEVEIEHRPRIAGTSSMRLVRGSIHRFMFVFYIGVRQLLLRMRILQRPMQ